MNSDSIEFCFDVVLLMTVYATSTISYSYKEKNNCRKGERSGHWQVSVEAAVTDPICGSKVGTKFKSHLWFSNGSSHADRYTIYRVFTLIQSALLVCMSSFTVTVP